MARGRKRADLDSDRQFNLALVRLLEIVGEAANRVPEHQRARIPATAREIMRAQRGRDVVAGQRPRKTNATHADPERVA
jgi:uncharacterized protein with HEPN domain